MAEISFFLYSKTGEYKWECCPGLSLVDLTDMNKPVRMPVGTNQSVCNDFSLGSTKLPWFVSKKIPLKVDWQQQW